MQSDPDGPAPEAADKRPSRAVVIVATVVVVFLIGLMTLLIWRRWTRLKEPTSAILVYGDPSLRGAEVVVTSVDAPGQHRVLVTLDDANKYQTPIFRNPGTYHVSVTWHDQVAFDHNVQLDRLRAVVINLPPVLTLVGDDSLSGATASITDRRTSASFVFTRADHFRIATLVHPGEWTLTVSRDGGHLVDEDFTIEPHTGKQIEVSARR